jgi:HPt (histidine-containing phosphotransfer) domain-containing protein
LGDEMQASLDRDDLEGAAQKVGALEHAFLQVRMAVEDAAPPEAQAPAELPAIGAGFVDQLSPDADAASRSLAMKLVDAFRSEAPTRLAELTDAIVREDADAVQRLAPALKGMSSLIGADPLAKLCALVEADARLRRIGSARRYVDQLQLELTRVLDALGRAAD